jgi:hypothetical protein
MGRIARGQRPEARGVVLEMEIDTVSPDIPRYPNGLERMGNVGSH